MSFFETFWGTYQFPKYPQVRRSLVRDSLYALGVFVSLDELIWSESRAV